MEVQDIRARLRGLASEKDAVGARRFFKTGPGEYGEGDVFLGVRVPVLRKMARDHQTISLAQAGRLLKSPIHEERLLALFILIRRYAGAEEALRRRIYGFYLDHTPYVNNWDLVDSSAEHIVGAFLLDRDKGPLYRLARSNSLWERRISILATFCFIKRGRYSDTLKIAKILPRDEEDLIHKAVGWMLREVGKRDLPGEEAFLEAHYTHMPRTMLRYAIEKFPEPKRQGYLKGETGRQG